MWLILNSSYESEMHIRKCDGIKMDLASFVFMKVIRWILSDGCFTVYIFLSDYLPPSTFAHKKFVSDPSLGLCISAVIIQIKKEKVCCPCIDLRWKHRNIARFVHHMFYSAKVTTIEKHYFFAIKSFTVLILLCSKGQGQIFQSKAVVVVFCTSLQVGGRRVRFLLMSIIS